MALQNYYFLLHRDNRMNSGLVTAVRAISDESGDRPNLHTHEVWSIDEKDVIIEITGNDGRPNVPAIGGMTVTDMTKESALQYKNDNVENWDLPE